MRGEIAEEIDAALREAEGGSPPGPEALFDHVYADPPPRLRPPEIDG
jgi:TPP-dependent pyruvate/acetoin dehydrogenase alpha subunit